MIDGALPLQAEGVHFSYAAPVVTVIDGLDLDVRRGELLGVVGPNGTGKTTLLHLLSGVLKPGLGQVRVHGTDIRKLGAKERARFIAMVGQNPAVPEGFTALEVVLMGRNPHLGFLEWEGPRDLDVARRCLVMTGAGAFAPRLLRSLSGGERQRVIIARALAQEASVLLLDEPTAHLDIGYQTGVLDVIEGIRRAARVTVVAAIHDLTLAAQYCDRVAVLHKGGITAIGPPGEVLTPDRISRVFGTPVYVVEHPVYGTPVILHSGKSSAGSEAGAGLAAVRKPDIREASSKEHHGTQAAGG